MYDFESQTRYAYPKGLSPSPSASIGGRSNLEPFLHRSPRLETNNDGPSTETWASAIAPSCIDSGNEWTLRKVDLSSLELLLYCASPISPSRLFEGIERIGPVFSHLDGQTECYPIAVLRKADHDRNAPELALSCGFPVDACEVKILDDAGQEVAVGEPGEICVRSPYVMAEYRKRPEQTASTLRDGWLRTDDIARADDRGYMFILDRKKDMIVSGGFNIYPREVEDVLATHAGVLMGAPDDKCGEAVTAFVVARGDAPPTAQELIDLVKQRRGPLTRRNTSSS